MQVFHRWTTRDPHVWRPKGRSCAATAERQASELGFPLNSHKSDKRSAPTVSPYRPRTSTIGEKTASRNDFAIRRNSLPVVPQPNAVIMHDFQSHQTLSHPAITSKDNSRGEIPHHLKNDRSLSSKLECLIYFSRRRSRRLRRMQEENSPNLVLPYAWRNSEKHPPRRA